MRGSAFRSEHTAPDNAFGLSHEEWREVMAALNWRPRPRRLPADWPHARC